MKYSHLLNLIQLSKLSPEAFAKRLGISGMTLRRWRNKDTYEEVPALYQGPILSLTQQLTQEGILDAKNPVVKEVLKKQKVHSFEAILKNLGLDEKCLYRYGKSDAEGNEAILSSLAQIGASTERKDQVDQNKSQIFGFKKRSKAWAERISTLWEALTSKQLSGFQKLIAYGSLFYLITPIDLIPDAIPGFGLVDDFAILGFASLYYMKLSAALKKT
ncbi:MAG: DUF1232 domain-containing protein [Deltaproteobacteria bacterium]|nr:DUF1232 domain-containing protein [Deltaproteobacteria bacterium]